MPSARTVLPILIGAAIGAGGILRGLHREAANQRGDQSDLLNQLRIAREENDLLARENEALRSLAQGGGEFAVPQEFLDRAEREFSLKFQSNPVVHRIATEELSDRIAASYESRYGPAGMDDRQEAYSLIGWLGPDDRLLGQFSAINSLGAIAWFDEESGDGWVTDRFDIENIPNQAALFRVLVRILLNQNFAPPPAYPGDDQDRAREALHEGSAAAAEMRYFSDMARSIGFMKMNENPEAAAFFESLSPFMRGLVRFPESEGRGYAEALYQAGNDKLQNVLRNPPLTTAEIFAKQVGGITPNVMSLPDLPEEPFLSETAGRLGLKLWLDALEDEKAANEISSHWLGDAYQLFPDGEVSAAVVWDVRMDSQDAADKLMASGLILVASARENDQPVTAGELVLTGQRRYLALIRKSEDQVRFINVATKESAERLMN
ncbi:hypothetical protein JIN85_13760 [Luteolibacter pohnpeiensis]|uniref:Uncharacterized protein n=1 Tax=Luteolibacter pohnpeiensis TaxID=454153 RepID=A0A934SE08_9BACT|nr:hypothetical protein [Luteolibacter pohnpeiensis]MBK1883488.1 hypothetical protein [Luteolibacter pohnpeiensis]